MFESYLGNGFISFDGRVLETWQPNSEGTGRLHVAVIKALSISPMGKGQHVIEIDTIYRTGTITCVFPEQHLDEANQIKLLVEAAQAQRG